MSGSSQAFGTVSLGANSTPTSIVVTNTGTGSTGVLATSLGGTNAANFPIDSDLCSGTVLAPGASCAVTVHFAPTVAGTDTATLTIGATPGGSVALQLSGTATAPGAIAVAPATNDFGPIVVGQASTAQTFTVTNSGGSATGALASALSGSDAAQFTLGSDTCTGQALGAGQSCTVSVTFAPNGVGTKSASLTVNGTPGGSTSATLAGTALAGGALSVAGTSDDLGSVTVGAVSAPFTFTVSNTGQAATGAVTTALTGTNASEFAIASSTCSAALAPGKSCTVTVTASPTSAGPKTATLNAASSPGGTAGVAITATGIAQAALSSTSTTQSFGSLVIGQTSTDALFTITNGGGVASGALTTAISGTNKADFKVDTAKTTCASALAAGASCTVAVTFDPSVASAESATVTTSGTPGGSVAIALSGTGLTAGALKISPTTYPYAATLLGQTTAAEAFTLSNTGQSATGTLTTSLTGSGAGQFKITSDACNGKTLAAAGTCAIDVEFAPTVSGGASATLLATATGAGGSVSASISGTGQAPAKLAWAAGAYACGATATGTTTSTTVTLDNTGDIAASAPTFALTGANPTDFTVASNTCTGGIAAKSSCTASITFAPKTTAGESATLTATAATGGSAATSLTGTGEVPAAFSIAPSAYTFASTVTGAVGPSQTFTITNSGGVPAGSTKAIAVALGGTDPGSFVLANNTCPATLNAGGTCSVQVTFEPAGTGTETASLGVTATPGTSASATLSGIALTPGALSVSATSYDFASILDGTDSAEQLFTISNTGGGTTTAISASISGTGSFAIDAAKSNCQGATLAGGGSCSIYVYFAPVDPGGAEGATLAVTASGNGSTSTTLTGTGLTAAALTLVSSSKNNLYGGYVDGTTSPAITFTIGNGGTEPTGAIAVNFGGANAGDFHVVGSPTCLANGLAGGSSCPISIDFVPSIVGAESATVNVSGAPGGTSGTITLGGTGYSVGPELVVSPNPATFAPKLSGPYEVVVFTATNVGGTATAGLTFSATSSNPEGGYRFDTPNPCAGVALAANGGSCQFNVTFYTRTTGTYPGSITVAEGTSDSVTVPISGTAVPDTLTASTYEWEITTCATQYQIVTLTNSGTVATPPLTSAFNPSATIANLGTFANTGDNCTGATLQPGGTCQFEILFEPNGACSALTGETAIVFDGSSIQVASVTLFVDIP